MYIDAFFKMEREGKKKKQINKPQSDASSPFVVLLAVVETDENETIIFAERRRTVPEPDGISGQSVLMLKTTSIH